MTHPSRRDVLLVGAAAAVFGGCAILRGGAKHPSIVPSAAELSADKLVLPRSELAAVEAGGVLQIKLGEAQEDLLLTRAGSSYLVVTARCPHKGCVVDFDRAENQWECPCHDSRFAADGALVKGPADRGLSPRVAHLQDDSLVIELRPPTEG